MKNKKFTYLLGFLVLVVWGIIVYRIFGSLGGGDDTPILTPVKMAKEAYDDYAIPKDTAHLLLNYKDPFSIAPQPDSNKNKSTALSKAKLVKGTTPTVFNWGFIKYSGYIRNPGSKKLIAVVSINGKTEMMSEGEMAEKVRLLKNLQDSIKISFNGKTTFIKIQSGAL